MASIVDYNGIMSQVTSELTLGIAAAAVGIGIIWGARVGICFVRRLLEDRYFREQEFKRFNPD